MSCSRESTNYLMIQQNEKSTQKIHFSILESHQCQKGGTRGEGSLEGPPTEEEEGGEGLSSEGEPDSLSHQSFEEVLYGWSRVLEDSGKPPPLTKE